MAQKGASTILYRCIVYARLFYTALAQCPLCKPLLFESQHHYTRHAHPVFSTANLNLWRLKGLPRDNSAWQDILTAKRSRCTIRAEIASAQECGLMTGNHAV
jgi:hypothetical protein